MNQPYEVIPSITFSIKGLDKSLRASIADMDARTRINVAGLATEQAEQDLLTGELN